MQILRPQSRPTQSETLDLGICVFTSPPGMGVPSSAAECECQRPFTEQGLQAGTVHGTVKALIESSCAPEGQMLLLTFFYR